MKQLFTGDTWCEPITLKKKSSGAVDLTDPTDATIKCCVVDPAGNKILETVTLVKTETGADWPNGIIIPVFTAANTLGVTTYGTLMFEVQVLLDGKTKTYPLVKFECVKGNIA